MKSELIELKACLASLESMIERQGLAVEEYERQKREGGYYVPPVPLPQYEITFPELRSFDLLCKDTLERALPGHSELAAKWYVHDNVGVSGPVDVYWDLVPKRVILQHALHLLEARTTLTSETPQLSPIMLPREYRKLADSVRLFFEDSGRECQDYDRNVFIMTRFQSDTKALVQLDATIRASLRSRKLIGHRADDRCYPSDRNLWDNVCTYMLCCKYGVAILEDIIVQEFNPNVALEYGFMRALGKPTLLLKEQRFDPRADILGTLWQNFDILDIETTVSNAINKWLDDVGLDAV